MPPDVEDIFRNWARPPGQTEQSKCDNAVSVIRNAISSSCALNRRTVTVFPKGSYRNRTNVRQDSDVDICVVYTGTDTFFFDLPEGTTASDFGIYIPGEYPFPTYRNDVENALVSYLGRNAVERGNKAFDVHENTYRVDADVVACFQHRRYGRDGTYLVGTEFRTDRGERIVNWPEQNYKNGVGKNNATRRRFKSVVRILKRLRNEIDENGISAAKPIPSYLIECLVWNVPNEGFGHETYTADVRWALAHLCNNTRDFGDCREWREINELKYLFPTSQPWSFQQVNTFLNAAWTYIGLG